MSVKLYVVDLKKEHERRNHGMYSSFLLHHIRSCLEKEEQAIMFLNKRGHSPSLTCKECGNAIFCNHCDISLSLHKHPKNNSSFLLCHYCGTIKPIPTICPTCQSTKLQFYGAGTQKAEEELKVLFPNARIKRMDQDTTGTKHAHSSMYQDMRDGKIDVLIGTQIVAKGLDIPHVTLVGVLNADVGLQIPDFRATERTYQLLSQVMGRVGRRGQGGTVIVQTMVPDNLVIQAALSGDYEGFYETVIDERRKFQYPPFTQLVKCTFVHHVQTKAYQVAQEKFVQMKEKVKEKNRTIEVFLAPALVVKQHDKYHYHVLLKGQNVQEFIAGEKFPSGWRIDVDPVDMG